MTATPDQNRRYFPPLIGAVVAIVIVATIIACVIGMKLSRPQQEDALNSSHPPQKDELKAVASDLVKAEKTLRLTQMQNEELTAKLKKAERTIAAQHQGLVKSEASSKSSSEASKAHSQGNKTAHDDELWISRAQAETLKLLAELKSPVGIGDDPTANSLILTHPVATRVRTVTPVLRWTLKWTPQVKTTKYTITITQRNDATFAWTGEAPGDRLELPIPAVARLQRGQIYDWQVVAELENKQVESKTEVRSTPARFAVLSQEQALRLDKIEHRSAQTPLQRACIDVNLGLLDDAEQEMNAIRGAKHNP